MEDCNPDPVSAIVWPWREASRGPSPAKRPNRRPVKAVLQAAVMVGVSLLFLLHWHKPVMAGIVAGLAVFTIVTSIAAPRVYDGMEHGLQRFGTWIGVLFSYLLLVPFFYLVFVPVRAALAAGRKDILCLKFDKRLASYWTERPPPDPADIHLSRPY